MPDAQAAFPHLPIPLTLTGPAYFPPRQTAPNRTDANRANPIQHSQSLEGAALSVVNDLTRRRSARTAPPTATLPAETPLLLEIQPDVDLDFLRSAFGFELLSEEENGFVIVTSKDVDLSDFMAKIRAFGGGEYGSGQTAKVYQLFPDETRWQHILSPDLLEMWPLRDTQEYIVDISVACGGDLKFPELTKPDDDDTAEKLQRRKEAFDKRRQEYYNATDKLQIERSDDLERLVGVYGGEILDQNQPTQDDGSSSDWFTDRVKISGLGLRDLAYNYPFIIEISFPDDLSPISGTDIAPDETPPPIDLFPPRLNAPAVCVIDSGIQEQHRLLAPAIDSSSSRCFLPGCSPSDVADYVAGGGHGTRVAGAVLFGEVVPSSGSYQLEIWLQNARVLTQQNKLPLELLPSSYIRDAVKHFLASDHQTRLYNHSINSNIPHRQRHMSVWASEIDALSFRYDVLFIQSAGNVREFTNDALAPGIRDHIIAGRSYPDYLLMDASRISNPGQSLQAITVGSIAYKDDFLFGGGAFAWKDGPSSFSKTGLGLWRCIKPDVVEYGGDWTHDSDIPAQFSKARESCPELVRSTFPSGGPEKDRDALGTSFAAPKVAHLAAKIQALLPDESTLLYRALIAQSARWPRWAETSEEKADIVRHIGYGLPDEERATSNSPHRITLITSGAQQIKAGQAHLYDVPIPQSIREVGEEFDIRIEVTLSYAARPKRTRRSHRYYLSTWLEWDASGRVETADSFRKKIFKGGEDLRTQKEGTIRWHIGKRADAGDVRGTSRNFSTLQKDWAVVKPYDLPEVFSLAVIGHQGWDRDPDAFAKYALAITFEVPGQEIMIYEEIRASVQQFVQTIVQSEVAVGAV